VTGAGDALERARRRYALAMTAQLPARADPRLCDAFATVPREHFLGPPPWTMVRGSAVETSDPADLYADVLVPLDAAKGINNGSPSLHALMLHRLGVRSGERVLHVGAGTGYYTALLAELTGPGGSVIAVEYDAALAAAARVNLARWPWVRVARGDGARFPTERTQRIYVNFAVADLPDAWLDQLDAGGRLVLPLGAPDPQARGEARYFSAQGAVLVVTRTEGGFAAGFDTPVSFIFAEGDAAGDPVTRRAVHAALAGGGLAAVTSLRRGPAPPGEVWLSTKRWSLCSTPPG
jgi:protein-L-isoaspartate(D-aspartate) O-methyltransferase